jgi:integrase
MPRKAREAYLRLKTGVGRRPLWIIRDGGADFATGLAEGDRSLAEISLAHHILSRHNPTAAKVTISVGDCLILYAQNKAKTAMDPVRIGYALDALTDFWANRVLVEVTPSAFREYESLRGVSAGTLRRELGVLRAALNFAVREGWMQVAPHVTLPARPAGRERWLTRDEVAALVNACRTPRRRHMARAILIGVYTGTRPGAIKALRWERNAVSGWIDADAGMIYRRGETARTSKKRQTPAPMPRQLTRLARRWRKDGAEFVVHWAGKQVTRFRSGWAEARTKAGLGPEVTPHVMRHTAITWAMQRGAPVAEASGYFGVSQKTMEDTYIHHHPEHLKGALAAMERRR